MKKYILNGKEITSLPSDIQVPIADKGILSTSEINPILSISEENRRLNQTDIDYDENIAGAAEELNTKFRPELQDKIDAEQNKVGKEEDSKDVIVEFDDDGTPKIKSLKTGLTAGNVSITWEADQKCIKPKITVNEFATKDEIIAAVRNAEYAFIACKDSIEVISEVCAPLPIPEPKETKKASLKNLKDLDE